jgi:dynein heavy chain
MVMVHQSVEHYSDQFAKKLRRHNFTTPKNYLDFISTYLRLLERKNKENLAQVCYKKFLLFVFFRIIYSNNV